MKIISVIEDEDVIERILKHLGLWEVNPPHFRRAKPRPTPKATGPPKPPQYHVEYSTSQLSVSDKWLYVDPVVAMSH
jgi:hypothetical protein